MTDLSTDITPAAPEVAKLRVYIGAAPGVGKTYQMLEDAHLMKKQGVDVVIGLIESHGRKETQDQVKDLEIIPRRAIPYRSVVLEEMDLDAILARHPHTCLVDELAHTNVPGSRNRKRYEDVLELLDAGINVMTAVNVQHLETLNDSVSRSADTQIRETIPDSFLKRADEVVNVDVTVEELRSRLKQGKIYAAEKIEQSLANFFRKGNLSMLRELALRTTAEEVGSRAAEYRRSQGLEQAPMPEKVMVCLSPRPGAERLLRVGARIAGRLATNWYAVRVESPDEDCAAWRSGRVSAHGRIPAPRPRAGRPGHRAERQERRRRADRVRATGEHLPRGLRAVGALAVRHSFARLGDQPLSGGNSRCHGAGGPHQQGAEQ
jgi:two-component system sensor histidine kinase KdpD